MHHQEMVKAVVIRDLDFVQLAESDDAVLGGLNTVVHGTADTGYTEAFASIDSTSLGQQTYTSSFTSTQVSWTSFSVTSSAEAEGSAIAQSGHSYSRSTARYKSTSIHIEYSYH